MRASEQAIVKDYLRYAYKKLIKARSDNQKFNSDRFPAISKEFSCAEQEFSVLSRLARDLGVSNPYEAVEFEISVIED